jgi:Holliday junction resolvasome RuvABC endonuclease subunit
MEISQDVAHRPIVFIRFNPDDYINSSNQRVPSCWRLNKLGVMTLTQKHQDKWNARMNVLLDRIQYWVDNQTDKTVCVEHLYYDGFD